MMNSRPRPRPLDGILYFNEPSNPTSDDQKELIINKVYNLTRYQLLAGMIRTMLCNVRIIV